MTAKTYQTKPIQLEAIRCRDAIKAADHMLDDLPEWLRRAHGAGNVLFTPTEIHIKALVYWEKARGGDWIMWLDGEIYICPSSVFSATYQEI